ncbi:hypothetical protein ALC53_04480 [Atta colombica]|uniref:Uncharacterized protein n=1 Tax=Atta colombica TaxID=520822 RepID=A0A195BLQ6_9HYME|nr:hypothetical protein ALC53_04480 [Atta colombica]
MEEKERSAGRCRREKEITGVFARKTKGQRRIKSIADKAAGQDAGAHLVSPGEWAFIMMPPGTNNRVHFVSPARGNNGVDGKMEEKEGGGRGRKRRRSYKAAPGKKKTSASSRKGGSTAVEERRKTDERREDGREGSCLEVE